MYNDFVTENLSIVSKAGKDIKFKYIDDLCKHCVTMLQQLLSIRKMRQYQFSCCSYMPLFLVHPADLVDDGSVVSEAGSVTVTVTVVGLAVHRDEVGVGSTQGPPSMKNFSDCAYITYTLVPLMAELIRG